MIYLPFKAGHLVHMVPQRAQRADHATLVASGGAASLEGMLSLSAWHNSTCVGAAGLIRVTAWRAVAWMILSDSAGCHMLELARKVKRVAALAPYRRIEMSVAEAFKPGHQFARLIGAVRETPVPMKFYGSDGGSEVMYAIVKD